MEMMCNSCLERLVSYAVCETCGGNICKECYDSHKTMRVFKSHGFFFVDEDKKYELEQRKALMDSIEYMDNLIKKFYEQRVHSPSPPLVDSLEYFEISEENKPTSIPVGSISRLRLRQRFIVILVYNPIRSTKSSGSLCSERVDDIEKRNEVEKGILIPAEFPHPSILNIYDVFRFHLKAELLPLRLREHAHELFYSEALYVVYEDFSMTLRNYMRHPQIETDEKSILRYYLQILKGIQHLNSNSIFHMDLNMENVVVADILHPRLLIMGFGKCLREPMLNKCVFENDQPNSAPEYFELVQKNTNISRNDIWSSGCILFEMLEGRHPFSVTGHNSEQLRKNVMENPIPSINEEKWSKELRELLQYEIFNRNLYERIHIDALIDRVERLIMK